MLRKDSSSDGADTTWYRGSGSGLQDDLIPVTVAAEIAGLVDIDTDVDDGCILLHIAAADELRLTDGRYQNIRTAGHGLQVFGLTVADGHSRILLEQQHAERLPDHHGAADDADLLAGHLDLMALQDLHDGLGRTWCEGIRIATHDAGDVCVGDTVEILQRIHLAKHRCLVDLLRERTHHENAVDLRILVDEVEDLLKLFVRYVFRKLIVLRLQAEIHEALLDAALIAEIGLLVADT